MCNKITKTKNGFTLLEVIVAVFIISLGVGGMAKLMPNFVSSASHNQNQLIAAYLGQEGIEIIRNIRDTNWLQAHNAGTATPPWNDGLANCATGCEVDYKDVLSPDDFLPPYGTGHYLNIDANGFYGYDLGTATKFKRKIRVVDGGDNLLIIADVSWQEKTQSYNFSVQEKIYQWY